MDEARAEWTSFVLLERFRGGDDRAADELFARYFGRLTSLARSRLAPRLARRTDPEDIVQSVYRSFFVEAREGRYTLSRGGDLWRLLAAITGHKLLRQVRRQTADRRSVDAEIPLDQLDEGRLLGGQPIPSPEDAAELADELEWVFSRLDPFARRVLELRLQGLQIAEIAEDTGRSGRTVRRSLARVRELMAGRLNDREIDSESAEPPRPSNRVERPTPTAEAPEPDPAVPLLSHRDFLLRRLIGAGRMGKVYEARPHDGGRDIAVKFLRKSLLHHPEAVRRFIGEARTVARLRHPNIVGTEGLGRTPGGSYFIVMDLVDGPNLAQILGRRAIAVDEAIRWAMETCDALEHAHEQGIIHCDLKPANLLLDGAGKIRVTDFGLARSLTEVTPWAAEVEGTAPFMAPEQASRCWGPIDHRTDVYGIGAVLFTLLTGRPPFIGRRLPDVLAEVIGPTPVVSPDSLRADLPEPVSDLCRKCLAKAAADRFPSVRELRSALEEARGDRL